MKTFALSALIALAAMPGAGTDESPSGRILRHPGFSDKDAHGRRQEAGDHHERPDAPFATVHYCRARRLQDAGGSGGRPEEDGRLRRRRYTRRQAQRLSASRALADPAR